MVNQTKVCQGERDLQDRSKKMVTHRFDFEQREDENYETGVSIELCPLFDFSIEPWMLLRHLLRELILTHQVVRYTGIDKEPRDLKILDVACGYAEQYTLIGRVRKAGGTKIKYVGVDIDRDKKVIAQQLRANVDYRIMDVLDIDTLPEVPFDVIICGETIEHFEEEKGIEFLEKMHEVLAPEGLLVMSFPTTLSETHRDNPFHLRLWDMVEMKELVEGLDMIVLDEFHLGVGKKFWEIDSPRLPTELMRTFASVVSEQEGPQAILIARKSGE
jgi:SAM-dependent methyltransferase